MYKSVEKKQSHTNQVRRSGRVGCQYVGLNRGDGFNSFYHRRKMGGASSGRERPISSDGISVAQLSAWESVFPPL